MPRVTPITARQQVAPEHQAIFDAVAEGRGSEGELAIIATAREKDCGDVWGAHVALARKAGTREEAIAAVRDRKDVSALAPDERAATTGWSAAS